MHAMVAPPSPARPSRRHRLIAAAVPVLRGAREMESEPIERDRVLALHRRHPGGLPTRSVPGFDRRFRHVVEELTGPTGVRFPSHVLTPRGVTPRRTVVHLHGGGFVFPVDGAHVRWATRLARDLEARVVLPEYPRAPEHTWRDSHDALVDQAQRCVEGGDEVVLSGDSAGGGLALAVAMSLRDRGVPIARLLLVSPWVDLTMATPGTEAQDAVDTWLFLGKARTYARWWAGGEEHLTRPEVSPALADLAGLPPALMFCGTRDLLLPGCRLLARRAAEAGWPLEYVEAPDLIHVYLMLPVPEARAAWRRIRAFLR
jgi:monoterpene epsilon-lactone hydrolase